MSPSILLRIAAAIALVQYTGHAYLFLSATPKHGPEEVAVINAMTSKKFNFSGFERSYWNLYFGYGLIVILWGAIEVALLWLIGGAATTAWEQTRPIAVVLLLANLGHAVLAWRYFFLLPVVLDGTVSVFLALAIFTL